MRRRKQITPSYAEWLIDLLSSKDTLIPSDFESKKKEAFPVFPQDRCDPIYYLFLEFFFYFIENPGQYSEKIQSYAHMYNLQNNKRMTSIFSALFLCEQAYNFLHGWATDGKEDFFRLIKKPLLEILRNTAIRRIQRRALRFMLFVVDALDNISIKKSELASDLLIDPEDFLRDFRYINPDNKEHIHELIDWIYYFEYKVYLIMTKTNLCSDNNVGERYISIQSSLFILIFLSLKLTVDDINKVDLIAEIIPDQFRFQYKYVQTVGTLQVAFKIRRELDLAEQLVGTDIKNIDGSTLKRVSSSEELLAFLDHDFLRDFVHSNNLVTKKMSSEWQGIQSYFENITKLCRDILLLGDKSLSPEVKRHAAYFLSEMKLFSNEPEDVQEKILDAIKIMLSDCLRKMSIFDRYPLGNSRWFDQYNDLLFIRNSWKRDYERVQPMLYAQDVNRSDLTELNKNITEKIKKFSKLETKWHQLRKLHKELIIDRFCVYINGFIERYPNSKDLQTVLDNLSDPQLAISKFYSFFNDLSCKVTSERDLINSILDYSENGLSTLRSQLSTHLEKETKSLTLWTYFRSGEKRYIPLCSIDEFLEKNYSASKPLVMAVQSSNHGFSMFEGMHRQNYDCIQSSSSSKGFKQ